jgi:hypothetical protein
MENETKKEPTPEKVGGDEATGDEEAEETSDAQSTGFIRMSAISKYLKGKSLRISGEAKTKLMERLTTLITTEIDKVIGKIPKLSKGDNKGTLKRKTILPEDLK